MNIPLASIPINIDPDIFTAGNLTLTWHGLFTLIAVALSVFLVERWSRREGLVSDAIMTVSVWAIIGGIVGARVFHVIDRWEDYYQHNPVRIVQIWSGGIAIYGAILGGFLFGANLYRNQESPKIHKRVEQAPPMGQAGPCAAPIGGPLGRHRDPRAHYIHVRRPFRRHIQRGTRRQADGPALGLRLRASQKRQPLHPRFPGQSPCHCLRDAASGRSPRHNLAYAEPHTASWDAVRFVPGCIFPGRLLHPIPQDRPRTHG